MVLKYDNLHSFSESVTCSFDQKFQEQSFGQINYDIYEGISLTIYDCNTDVAQFDEIPTIYGILHDSKKIFSLQKNQVTINNEITYSMINIGVNRVKIISKELYIGSTWFNRDQKFTKAQFSLDFFDNWFTHGSLEDECRIKTKIPLEEITFELFELLYTDYTGHKNAGVNKSIYETKMNYLLEYDHEKTGSEIRKNIRRIQNFYTFLLSRASPIKKISFYTGPGLDQQHLFINQISLKEYSEVSVVKLCKYDKIFDNLPKMLTNWLSIYDKYRVIIENTIGDIEKKSYIENVFLNNCVLQ
ncbi:hypothetical protein [Atopococcus tabaci]|uniref:ApeA N-terminal domain 1-containing protein n=1 Tax=Atopococcus tabaci TaxID=269774 RepID=UPI0004239D57|nr:hypothetical protein [Atopococcus tabaci]